MLFCLARRLPVEAPKGLRCASPSCPGPCQAAPAPQGGLFNAWAARSLEGHALAPRYHGGPRHAAQAVEVDAPDLLEEGAL